MSLNEKSFKPFRVMAEDCLKQGKEIVLLNEYKYNETKKYYQLGCYTGFIESIKTSSKKDDMKEVTIIFANGVKATTQSYIDDDNIKENSLVSIIGYVVKYNGEYQLFCRGITPIYTSIEELVDADLDKFIKVDLFISLTELKESEVYLENEEIYNLENTNYYYAEKKKNGKKQVISFLLNKDKQKKSE